MGGLFIAEPYSNRVVEVKADGTQTSVGSGLSYPAGVAVDSMGDVFIADSSNDRVVNLPAGVPVRVSQAAPLVNATDPGGVYNQSPFAATATVTGVDGIAGPSLENVTPTLMYYSGSTAQGTPLAGAPMRPGTYTVKASFAGSPDYTAASATATFTINVPKIALNGPTIGVPGQPLTYSFTVNGPTQGITFTIDYGDGTRITTSSGGPSIQLDHLYTTTGRFTIKVRAMDQNQVVSLTTTQAVTINTVALEADASGGTALAIGGNAAGGDSITITATTTGGKTLNVNLDATSLGTFRPTGHLFVYGQGGNDRITLAPYVLGTTDYYIKVPAFLYGEGSGGDTISAAGSAANNVLSGHGANEVLIGGHGRDLLIGGTGTATLKAGAKDDILISGWTDYDINSSGMTYEQKLAALDAIMAEWSSAGSYSTRVIALAVYLNTSTVHASDQSDVAVVDRLQGNAKANDWFFASLDDKVTGKNNIDVISIIS
jgi:hypothetical protein